MQAVKQISDPTYYCDWLSGSDFVLQTSKFLFIDATAMTLGQGHR